MSQSDKASSTSVFPWKEIFILLGILITAYFGYLGIRSQIEIPIHATQTAEARLTLISPSQTPLVITTTPSFIFTPTIVVSTPSPITTSNCSLNIGQKVNLRKNVRYWTKPNVLDAQFSPEQPEISVYILSGPIWGRVRADIDYSGWWWEVSANENGASLGWIWEMGFEECN